MAVINLGCGDDEGTVDPNVESSIGNSRSVEPNVLSNFSPLSRLESPTSSSDRHSSNSVAEGEGCGIASGSDLS